MASSVAPKRIAVDLDEVVYYTCWHQVSSARVKSDDMEDAKPLAETCPKVHTNFSSVATAWPTGFQLILVERNLTVN